MIFKPLVYLRIKHEQKSRWDVLYPLAAAILATIVYFVIGVDLQLVGQDGVLRQVNGLLGVLSGFYIASLTAISALNTPSLNEKMSGDPPTLKVKEGKGGTRTLKRGEFLRYLFGYLSVTSIALFFAGIILDLFYGPVIKRFPLVSDHLPWMGAGVLFLYVLVLSNLIINTLVGVYYLTDRMHREDPNLGAGKIDPEDPHPDEHPELDEDIPC